MADDGEPPGAGIKEESGARGLTALARARIAAENRGQPAAKREGGLPPAGQLRRVEVAGDLVSGEGEALAQIDLAAGARSTDA